jgi:hypothetical protein
MNNWNILVKIRDNHLEQNVRDYANLLLGQLNTAGGKHLIRDEVENFINEYHEDTLTIKTINEVK